MASNCTVRADIVDANSYAPLAGETFLVDTNVWFWMCYAAAPDAPGVSKPWQTRAYPAFLDRILKGGGKLCWSALSWSELGHIIERTEWKIAVKCGATATESPKQYRYEDASERQRIVETIQQTWLQVTALASSLGDTIIDESALKAAHEELSSVMLDGYDLFMAQSLRKAGIRGVITDDGDFCTVSGITVFTANRTTLGTAKSQGKIKNA